MIDNENAVTLGEEEEFQGRVWRSTRLARRQVPHDLRLQNARTRARRQAPTMHSRRVSDGQTFTGPLLCRRNWTRSGGLCTHHWGIELGGNLLTQDQESKGQNKSNGSDGQEDV